MKNRFGSLFSMTSWGESHGPAVGVVIDGCPAGIPLNEEDFSPAMSRRRPGKEGTSPRKELDHVSILSGVYQGKTTGAPISLYIANIDADSSPYLQTTGYRPGHAHYAYEQKYGAFDPRGGGRASARETAGRVAAGVVAAKFLAHYNLHVLAFLSSIGHLSLSDSPDFSFPLAEHIYRSPFFSPLPEQDIRTLLHNLKEEQDSIGGVVSFITSQMPIGLGEPIFGKLPALLASACMSIPAAKGFAIGLGFDSATKRGSTYTDPFIIQEGEIPLAPNHCGGCLGGISIGMPIQGQVAFKPTSSIQQPCATVTKEKEPTYYTTPSSGRHDPCVAIRAVPVVEAMVNLVLADAYLQHRCAVL